MKSILAALVTTMSLNLYALPDSQTFSCTPTINCSQNQHCYEAEFLVTTDGKFVEKIEGSSQYPYRTTFKIDRVVVDENWLRFSGMSEFPSNHLFTVTLDLGKLSSKKTIGKFNQTFGISSGMKCKLLK